MPIPTEQDVARLLGAALGRGVRLGPPRPIGSWSIACWPLLGDDIASVVVKWLRPGDPEDPAARADARQLGTEAAALTFLADVGVPAPHLLASDQSMLILVDLVDYEPLDALIRRNGFSEHVVTLWRDVARLLAMRHTRTAPVADRFHALVSDTIAPPSDAGAWQRLNNFATTTLDLPATPDVLADLAEARRRLCTAGENDGGPLLALSNGDSTSNNVLVGPDGCLLIDYEFATYRHCLRDLMDFYLPGPRWVTVPDPVEVGFEDAYRGSLGAELAGVLDERRFGVDLAAAGFDHAIHRLGNLTVVDGRLTGDRSRLERRRTAESVAALSSGRGAFPALTGWFAAIGLALRGRWPDVNVDDDRLPTFLAR